MIRRSFLKAFAATGLIPGRGKRMPFGNAVGEGFVNPGIVVAKKVIVESATGGIFSYSGSPALGNLISTEGIAFGSTDAYGNEYLTGNTTYYNISGNFWMATEQIINGFQWYFSSTGPGGPYTLVAELTVNTTGTANVSFGGTSGSWPQSSVGVTTVAQVVTLLKNLGLAT